jgi:hypothetical protein
MQFHLGDPGIVGGPAIQYNNSVYNGIFFAAEFASPNGNSTLRLNMQGRDFSLRNLTSGATLFGGRLNVGVTGLTDIEDFRPAAVIPEPETYALMLAGLGLLGFAVRRRRRG